MPKKLRRTEKKTAKSTLVKKSAVRRKTKKPVSVQVFPKVTLTSQIQTAVSSTVEQLNKKLILFRAATTQFVDYVQRNSSKGFAKQKKAFLKSVRTNWRKTQKSSDLFFKKAKKQTVLFAKTASTAFVQGTKAVFRELIYPFYYIFRYHFWATVISITVTVLIFGGAYATYEVAFRDLPQVSQIVQRQQLLTTKILDRNGKLLYRIFKDENRTLVPLSRVPLEVQQATIAIEDRDFYHHNGISVKGIVRALRENARGSRIQGGSTITQQLVKNTLLTSEKTYKRKIREVILAVLVEQTFSKEEILEMYLNEVAYGGSTYGIEEAAQRYFGKSAAELNLTESSFLAGLPQSPSLYSPFGSSPERAYARQREVLRRMVEDGYITQEAADQARQTQLAFRSDTTDIKAPHFVMYVREMLAEQYGEELVSQGGLEVVTSLDLDFHNEVQTLVSKEMETLARLRIANGAALVTNPITGEVISMVGSKNYFDFKNDGQVNVTIRPRQPGSSIKPLTYALAFENGQSPYTTIADEPVTFAIVGSAPYAPKNYDGKFHGNVTLREALGSSYNIPAVKLLAQVGISTLIDKGEQMGITTWKDRKRFGLSLTLGGGEVLMTELAQVFGTFANKGVTTKLNPILEIKNSKGEVIYKNRCVSEGKDCPSTRTVSAKTATQITDVLTDNTARTPAFGARSVLNIPGQQVAVKTGTTNNLRDNWTFGYTKDRVVAVWVGNNDNTPMSYVASGVTGASPIWNKIIRLTLDDKKPHSFSTPEGMVRVKICVPTKTLACRGCPVVRDELFDVGTEPTTACSPSQFRPKPSASPNPNRDQILDGTSVQVN
jgi:1A family penicillin-binding protein